MIKSLSSLPYAIALGVILALYLRRVSAVGLRTGATSVGLLAPILAGVVGARIFYLIAKGDLFSLSIPAWFSFNGTASWGAYLGGSLALFLYLRHRGLAPVPYFDVAASCGGLGVAIGRWACFLNGDDFGRVSEVAWAIRYPAASQAWNAHVSAGLISADAPSSLLVHPFQLYLSFQALLTFLVCSAIWRRYRDRPGITLAAYLLMDGVGRFVLEFLRDPAAGGSDRLSVSQVMCVLEVSIALTIALIRLLRWRAESRASLEKRPLRPDGLMRYC